MNKHSKDFSADAILKTWIPFREALGIAQVQTAQDYKRAMAIIDELLAVTGGDENHPCAELLDFVAGLVEQYEEEQFPIPVAEPRDMLRFMMEQHGLDQSSFGEEIPQSRISEILSGRRGISKKIAGKLAARFGLPLDVFLKA